MMVAMLVNYTYWTIAFPILTLIFLLLFFRYYLKTGLPTPVSSEHETNRAHSPFLSHLHPVERKDILFILAITLIYAAISFFKLGDMTAPQSFFRFSADDNSVVITLSEPTGISAIKYYTGLWNGNYTMEFSQDGKTWVKQNAAGYKDYGMEQSSSKVFKWLFAGLNDSLNNDHTQTKYIRITASNSPMELGEMAIYDRAGKLVPADKISCADAPQLFDEQNVIPKEPSYMNSTYFDEVYHARTAYENLNNITPYETTHPPLGKLIISVGIGLFGMVPFGWRFMGTLCGVIMLPILYIFLKNMFGKTPVAACGTILLGVDFMHFVQTRIATIDTYGVLFILLAYFFMYRYMAQEPEAPFKKTLPPLALSGLFWGIACASKWTGVYAGLGLAVLYTINLVSKYKYYKRTELAGFGEFFGRTLLYSILCFIEVPVVIYCLSYIPYGLSSGMSIGKGMLWDPRYYRIIWDSQLSMYHYHSTLVATHAYSSPWWSWILDARPISYFSDTSVGKGLISEFASFGNPIVWWGGFLAMVVLGYRSIRYRDGKALFIVIGYLSQLAPWFFITRIVFIYHYFPSVLFLVLALAYVLDGIWERKKGRYKLAVYGFTGAAVFLFIIFYPVLSGIPVSRAYAVDILRWIPPLWPF